MSNNENNDDCPISGFAERNNTLELEITDENILKSTRLSDLHKQVMSRPNRIGLPQIFVKFGNDWIRGKTCCSNLGYDFRGQISTNLYPQIDHDMTLFEMIYG